MQIYLGIGLEITYLDPILGQGDGPDNIVRLCPALLIAVRSVMIPLLAQNMFIFTGSPLG